MVSVALTQAGPQGLCTGCSLSLRCCPSPDGGISHQSSLHSNHLPQRGSTPNNAHMHAQTLAAGLPVLAGFVSLAIQMNRMRSAPCQDLGGQRWPQRRERLRPSSCPALGWACALGLGEGVSVLCGLAPHKACPRQPEPLLGTSKGAGAILSKPQGQSSNNELDPLKSQLSWKSSLPFLWSGAWPRSLCPLDRLGPWEGPASQSVWPGLKVCGGQQPAPSLERGPGAAAADDIGKAGLCFLPSPHPGCKTLAAGGWGTWV